MIRAVGLGAVAVAAAPVLIVVLLRLSPRVIPDIAIPTLVAVVGVGVTTSRRPARRAVGAGLIAGAVITTAVGIVLLYSIEPANF